MRYYIRHKFGVSKDYNTFECHPWHGTGQGATDAALRYIVLSDTIIDAYHEKVAPIMMCDPTTTIEILHSLKAFIDNVVLHAADPGNGDINKIAAKAQMQLRWWNQLIAVTGGALNPKKCCGMLYQWTPDKYGILRLCNPTADAPPIKLSDEDHSPTISMLKPNEGTRYLGLYLTTNRDTKPMESYLWDKAVLYMKALQHTPMNHREATVLYKSCFLPALTYPFPATWLLDSFFAKIHKLSMSTILNKMGFHRNLPWELVFAPRSLGGVGLSHL